MDPQSAGLIYLQGAPRSYSFGGSASGSPIRLNSDYGLKVVSGPDPGPLTIGAGLRKVQQGASSVLASSDAAIAESNRLLQQLLASQRPVAPQPIDIAAINAQARKQAEESVNPIYTKKLNDMLARLAVRRQRAQQDYQTALQTYEDNLKQARESNELERTRIGEDVATNLAELGTLEDRFQAASGTAFDDRRIAEAGQLAAGGLTTSGIGRQQVARAESERNVSEQQQTEDFQAQRTAQAIFRARTFEDLARADILAGEKAEKGKKTAKLDLDRLIEDLATEESRERFSIEAERLGDISGRVSDYSQSIFNNILAGIRDPRVLQATAETYGGLF